MKRAPCDLGRSASNWSDAWCKIANCAALIRVRRGELLIFVRAAAERRTTCDTLCARELWLNSWRRCLSMLHSPNWISVYTLARGAQIENWFMAARRTFNNLMPTGRLIMCTYGHFLRGRARFSRSYFTGIHTLAHRRAFLFSCVCVCRARFISQRQIYSLAENVLRRWKRILVFDEFSVWCPAHELFCVPHRYMSDGRTRL